MAAVIGQTFRSSVKLFSKLSPKCPLTNKLSSAFSLRKNNAQIWCGSVSPSSVAQIRCQSTSTSSSQEKLMEFFDDRENWAESNVRVGRPWKPDELRLKSNTDLHKLWYVLLKERNMLLTMEEEYKRQCELFPNPERIFKVEESMENVLDVIAERDAAVNNLETGKSGEPEKVWILNEIGVGHWRTIKEHYMPPHMNKTYMRRKRLLKGDWTVPYLKLLREKRLKQIKTKVMWQKRNRKELEEMYPDKEID